MNILIAADYATPASGNFIASCVELGRALNRNGDKIAFIFPESSNTLAEHSWIHWLKREGHAVYLVRRNITGDEVIHFLRPIIAEHNIDILHIHFGLFHHIAVYRRKELGVKVLVHDHMDFPAGCSTVKQKLQCAARSLLYRKNGVSVASVNCQKNQAYCFAQHWYIPNGLSLIRNVPCSASREECRTELGIAPHEKICLFLGWDLHRKGLDIAVKAVNKIREADPNILLGIVGIGDAPNSDGKKFILDTTGIDPESPWIKYLPSREDMFAYHRAADVYLSASRSEAFSYGILEAISQNTPITVSDIKGTSWCHPYTKSLCGVVTHTSEGLTKSELTTLLGQCGICAVDDGSSCNQLGYTIGLNKRDWLYNCLVTEINKSQSFSKVFSFLQAVLNPASYTSVDSRQKYRCLFEKTNKILLFAGLSIDQSGRLVAVSQAETLTEVDQRVNHLKKALYDRAIHSEVQKYCVEDYLRADYYDAVFEAAKGLAERVRQISGLTTDGGTLFQTAFSKNDPYIFFNAMKTDSERSEFIGLKELLEAIFHLVRNPAAHTPKVNWKTDETKTLDILTLISFAHKYLDECHRMPGK